ncbi:hypothetical protein BX666DRAFT_1889902 [Dichotomocladium elegans]|nr:hypothetical protein BX666DRAFT_1889902 [Dichotomocladium elegans]
MSKSALLITSPSHTMPSIAPHQEQHHHRIPPPHYPPSPQTVSSSPLSTYNSTTPRRRSILDAAWPYNMHYHHHRNRASSPSSSPGHQSSSASWPSRERHTSQDVPAFFNLEKVVHQYSEQPELLGLILSSKVEEDRRRAEEAKLKQKEIDYLLQQSHNNVDNHPSGFRHNRASWRSMASVAVAAFTNNSNISSSNSSSNNSSSSSCSSRNSGDCNSSPLEKNKQLKPFSAVTRNLGRSNNPLGSILPRIQSPGSIRRDSVESTSAGWKQLSDPCPRLRYSPKPLPADQRRRSIQNIDMLLSHSPRTASSSLPPISISSLPDTIQAQDDPENHPPLPVSSPPSSLDSDGDTEMAASFPAAANHHDHHPHLPFDYHHEQQIPGSEHGLRSRRPPPTLDKLPIPPVSAPHRLHRPSASKRRRREVQAISTIIETREFPYNDDYLWKNNGNTVHKKTGHRSIYYKCSNSAKGCPVNKTVTFKEHGDYLIKYRGKHLEECSRIKRIVDV